MTHHDAFEKHDHTRGTPCRVCSGTADEGKAVAALGVCRPCWYKILIVVLIVMIALTYVVFFGVL